MSLSEDFYIKFPTILRDKLLKNEIKFPNTIKFDYEKLLVYRAINRKENDNHAVTLDDFKSYFELKKNPKRPRGPKENITKNPYYYGVSSFLKRGCVEQLMKFPNPNKKMIKGYVYKEGGPQDTKDLHVCWWLYEKVDISGFEILEDYCDE